MADKGTKLTVKDGVGVRIFGDSEHLYLVCEPRNPDSSEGCTTLALDPDQVLGLRDGIEDWIDSLPPITWRRS